MRSERDKTVLSEINVTPLVDVMLVLLIIFMVTAPLLKQGIDINLPKAKGSSLSKEERFTITIKKDGTIYLNRKKITQNDLFTQNIDRILCPDQAIYFSLRNNYKVLDNGKIDYQTGPNKASALEQAALMVSFILSENSRRSWTTSYIEANKIAELLKLDSEKYRQKV